MSNSPYQHMVHDYYVSKVRKSNEMRREILKNIRTKKNALAYQEAVKKAINKAFSPRPRKTVLNPKIVGFIQKTGYRIEKLTFESRPGCLVTANLYIPDNIKGKAPGVVGTCGHSMEGKACDLYQGFCQRLVHSGFVVLIYDPFNQGERDQYSALEKRSAVNSCCPAHNMMGKQLELLGQFFGMWRAWDGIRALDYLLTRPEVDPDKIGVTGNSGGGTMSTWIWGLEDRFAMAAPSCFVTMFQNNLENELPQDNEQYPPGLIGAGFEMIDFMIARAPKPAILLGQTYDYFDRRGLKEGYEELRRFYSILGAPEDNVALFIGPQGHGYSIHNQEAMVDFFAKHTGQEVVKVPETEILEPKELFATPEGDVVKAGATPIYEMISKEADRLADKRKSLDVEPLKKAVMKLFKVSDKRTVPYYSVLRPARIENKTYARYAIETEDNIKVILKKRMTTPHAGTLDVEDVVNLYLPHVSSEDDIISEPMIASIEDPLYILDVRGLGESLPESAGSFFQPYGMDYMFHGFGLLLDESYMGRRIHDVLSTMDLMINEGAKEIKFYGRGQGAILALFVGLLHDHVVSVTVKNCPASYTEWGKTPLVSWPSAFFPKGILKMFDLPDIMDAMENKLKLIEPWEPDMKPENASDLG
ncbi:prolyl oligopeptidase family serine peptidase [Candidatus Poribacteria bacterium]|nr:prolyl oligopeptidase family serine peptidase [Candidatus Poribacteria bacterium]